MIERERLEVLLDRDRLESMRLSVNQERLFDALLRSYLHDPFALVPGYTIRPLLGSNRLAVLRVKLRRVGWDIVSKNGKHGGYRLARLLPPEGT